MADTKKPSKAKEARVTIRVDAKALETVRAMAQREERAVSQMLRLLLSEALRARLGKR